jgi:hypothetical protein
MEVTPEGVPIDAQVTAVDGMEVSSGKKPPLPVPQIPLKWTEEELSRPFFPNLYPNFNPKWFLRVATFKFGAWKRISRTNFQRALNDSVKKSPSGCTFTTELMWHAMLHLHLQEDPLFYFQNKDGNKAQVVGYETELPLFVVLTDKARETTYQLFTKNKLEQERPEEDNWREIGDMERKFFPADFVRGHEAQDNSGYANIGVFRNIIGGEIQKLDSEGQPNEDLSSFLLSASTLVAEVKNLREQLEQMRMQNEQLRAEITLKDTILAIKDAELAKWRPIGDGNVDVGASLVVPESSQPTNE